MVEVILIGAGDRGKDRYGAYIENHDHIRIVAVAEPNPLKREFVMKKHGIAEEMCFDSWEPLLAKEKFADGVIIATSDADHYLPTLEALKKDYHVLLEKPMSNRIEESIAIAEAEKKSKGQVLVCHVLRYTPLYKQLKALVRDGKIGKLQSIQHNENIGYYHFAHSFVRGNWRNTKESSPLILAKSCHDMDILYWLADSPCKSIQSFGHLSHFHAGNSKGFERCAECNFTDSCPFATKKIYTILNQWPTSTITPDQTPDGVHKALMEGPYGRCVYHCDNDVVDHQVTTMCFQNEITATFNLCAFTNDISRTIKLMGTEGTIKVKDAKNEIILQRFNEPAEVIVPEVLDGGHGGGDVGIMNAFSELLQGEKHHTLTNGETSLMSHLMSCAAETSRLKHEVIDIEDFKKNI